MADDRGVKMGLAEPVHVLSEVELLLRGVKAGLATPVWIINSSGGSGNADTLDGQEGTWYLDRANHTGTQLANTISDFDTQVQTNGLDELAVPTTDVDLNGQKIINLATPIDPTDAANKDYVDNAIAAVGATTKYATTIGDTVATSFLITHNLNTLDVIVTVRVATGSMFVVYPDIEILTVNTLTISFTLAPDTDEYRVVVIG